MPQLTLTDGELLKKTMRTTLVMLGTTVLWLGGLTGAVMMSTGPAASAEAKAEKAEKADKTTPASSAGTKSPIVPPHKAHAANVGPAHDPI